MIIICKLNFNCISTADKHIEMIRIKHFLNQKNDNSFHIIDQIKLKFGDGDGPNLCENIFRSGLTLVSSNDIITIKIDKEIIKNRKKINKQKRLLKK